MLSSHDPDNSWQDDLKARAEAVRWDIRLTVEQTRTLLVQSQRLLEQSRYLKTELKTHVA